MVDVEIIGLLAIIKNKETSAEHIARRDKQEHTHTNLTALCLGLPG